MIAVHWFWWALLLFFVAIPYLGLMFTGAIAAKEVLGDVAKMFGLALLLLLVIVAGIAWVVYSAIHLA
jgi:hypothetical protein